MDITCGCLIIVCAIFLAGRSVKYETGESSTGGEKENQRVMIEMEEAVIVIMVYFITNVYQRGIGLMWVVARCWLWPGLVFVTGLAGGSVRAAVHEEGQGRGTTGRKDLES